MLLLLLHLPLHPLLLLLRQELLHSIPVLLRPLLLLLLRGELGSVSLCAGDAEEEEEFLSAATTPHQIMESTP